MLSFFSKSPVSFKAPGSFALKQTFSTMVAEQHCHDDLTEHNESAGGEFEPSTTRLARNRVTARVRRERKKREAERLTCEMTEVKLRQSSLKKQLKSLPEGVQTEIINEIQSKINHGDRPRGCLFCDFVFNSDQEIVRHYHNDHSSELKSNKACFGEEFSFEQLLHPEEQLNKLEECSKSVHGSSQSMSADGENMSTNSSTIKDSSRCLSSEEKRKRRLERNAESARLCRQRKKLYIQKLRLELPKIKYYNKLLDEYLNLFDANQTLKNTSSNVEPVDSEPDSATQYETLIPPLSGWDHTEKRYKTVLSSTCNLKKRKESITYKVGSCDELDSSCCSSSRIEERRDWNADKVYKKQKVTYPQQTVVPGSTAVTDEKLLTSNNQNMLLSNLTDLNYNIQNLTLFNSLLLNSSLFTQHENSSSHYMPTGNILNMSINNGNAGNNIRLLQQLNNFYNVSPVQEETQRVGNNIYNHNINFNMFHPTSQKLISLSMNDPGVTAAASALSELSK